MIFFKYIKMICMDYLRFDTSGLQKAVAPLIVPTKCVVGLAVGALVFKILFTTSFKSQSKFRKATILTVALLSAACMGPWAIAAAVTSLAFLFLTRKESGFLGERCLNTNEDNPDAQYALATQLLKEVPEANLKRDEDLALNLLQKAAAQGHQKAKNLLRVWSKKISSKGDLLKVGIQYWRGNPHIRMPADKSKAIEYWKLSAEDPGGNSDAQYKLAQVYYNGCPEANLERNEDLARFYFERAAAQGHKNAKLIVKELEGSRKE